jgi:hypothetical protein
MLEALTALFFIVIFYTVLALCGLIQFVANRYRAKRGMRNVPS